MTCGIVTFYDCSNHGAVLQAYALQQALENLDFDAFHISFDRQNAGFSTEGMHPFLRNMVLHGRKRDELFESFRKKYIKEKTFSPEIVNHTDCFIVGSDQVWNPEITGGDPAYFLQFADPEKRMSYGASFGKDLKDGYKEIYRNGVKGIPFLSVRENKAAVLIEELSGRKAETVVDPVFLLRREEWEKLMNDEPKRPNESYILLIMVQNDINLLEEAKKEAEEKGLSLKLITASYFPPVGYQSWSEIGPIDFLRLIHDSQKVITSSFHGLAFSLIFEKPYQIVRLTGDLERSNLRLDDLCERFGLPYKWHDKHSEFEANISRESFKSLEWLKNTALNMKDGKMPADYVPARGPEIIKRILLQCTGCTACVSVCHADAIRMRRREDGFSYPSFDLKKCTLCGKCSHICPPAGGHNTFKESFHQQFFAFKAENQFRMRSTSGGAFAVIANELLPEVKIYSVTMNDRHSVLYDVIKEKVDISRFTKTCYVEAEVGDTYLCIREDLANNIPVVFMGDPCKVAGLLAFIGCKHPLLTTIDHICNGVPSPGKWEKYMKKLEEQGIVTDYRFRAKESANRAHSVTYVQNGKVRSTLFNEDPWSVDYSKGIELRKACYSCKYARTKRVSDLTLGDFWGIENSYPKFDDGYGVSIILINTEKGLDLVNKIQKYGQGFFVTEEEALQPRLQTPPRGRAERKNT